MAHLPGHFWVQKQLSRTKSSYHKAHKMLGWLSLSRFSNVTLLMYPVILYIFNFIVMEWTEGKSIAWNQSTENPLLFLTQEAL